MSQLSLLDWQPPPELMQEPEMPPEPLKINLNAIAYWQARLNYYTQKQVLFCTLQMQENKLYRKLEITRLQAFRGECKSKLESLNNGCSN